MSGHPFIKRGKGGPDTYHNFERKADEHEDCELLVALGIPGQRHQIPPLYCIKITCDLWSCQHCGPIHRQQWYEALLGHLREATARGETVYFSWVDGRWDTTYKAIERAHRRDSGDPEGFPKYVKMRHENGRTFVLTTADIGGEEIEAVLLPYVLPKCLEYIDLGKRPISTSKTWGLTAKQGKPKKAKRPRTGLVFLGMVKTNFEEKIKEICRRTGAHATRWGTSEHSPRIIDGYDEAWHSFGNFRALVYDVIGIRGSPLYYDPTECHEMSMLRLWEDWPPDLENPQKEALEKTLAEVIAG